MSGWLAGGIPGNTFQSTSMGMASNLGTASTMSTGATPDQVQAELGQMMQTLETMMQSFAGGAATGGFADGSQQSLMAASGLGGGFQDPSGLMAGSLGGGMSGVSIAGDIGGVPVPMINGQLGPQGFAAIDMGLNSTMGIIQSSLSSVRINI